MKRWIHAATYNGFDDGEFDEWQMREIREGLKSGVDITQYADPKFNHWQMEQIRYGLESGVDISKYANPKFDDEKMEKIRKALESGRDISSLGSRKWPTKKEWQEGDLDELWEAYLAAPEAKVNKALEIEVEPSTQAGMGSVAIYDISEEGDGEQIASIDFGDWCEMEVELASSVRSAKKYTEEYRAWITSNI